MLTTDELASRLGILPDTCLRRARTVGVKPLRVDRGNRYIWSQSAVTQLMGVRRGRPRLPRCPTCGAPRR
ncbi:MAG TPA: hypothetical protein PLU35_05475 [Phycisphaerales bacterium]|nr:hypothetical protein [Phycisphaerales bacterium]